MDDYTVDYYRSLNTEEAPQAQALAQVLTQLYHPRSVIDLGCGTGLYLEPFDCRVEGLDCSLAAFDDEVRKIPREWLTPCDLTIPFQDIIKSDISLCLEVVEHVGSEHADTLVANICRASDTIILTAAPPGQAGLNHVNCQPQAYWEAKFAAHGFKRDYHDECAIVVSVSKTPHTFWLIRNLMVFKRQ